MRDGEDDPLDRQFESYDRTGRRLFILGLILLLLLGGVTLPLTYAVVTGLPAFIEKSDGGPVLAGSFVGLGTAAAGVFFGAAMMLERVPAILAARHVPGSRDAETAHPLERDVIAG
jgi:hypothetical protein